MFDYLLQERERELLLGFSCFVGGENYLLLLFVYVAAGLVITWVHRSCGVSCGLVIDFWS